MDNFRSGTITIEVVEGDAVTFRSDVLALKYAQQHYGVDRIVADLLREPYPNLMDLMPKVNGVRFLTSRAGPASVPVGAAGVLFVGVKPLREFGY